jgi:protein-S-isoprenylcysteine O-methyltransferase Ste14
MDQDRAPVPNKGTAVSRASRSFQIAFAILGAVALVFVMGFWFTKISANLPQISMHGWIAMSLGVLFSLLIGCGLMWLSFYSSRNGFDDRADSGRLRAQKDVNRP